MIGEKKGTQVNPNKLVYEPTLSSRVNGIWVGYCKGDSIHREHFVRIISRKKFFILNNRTDSFKIPNIKTYTQRLFPVTQFLRCPSGKTYMRFDKLLNDKLAVPEIEIYKCEGSYRGFGHKEHYLRIQHGRLAGKDIGMLVITMES